MARKELIEIKKRKKEEERYMQKHPSPEERYMQKHPSPEERISRPSFNQNLAIH
jgi:hypothetical protein